MNASGNETKVHAPEIVCDGCARSIERALGALEGVTKVRVDVEAKDVFVEHDAVVSREAIVASLDRAGFTAD